MKKLSRFNAMFLVLGVAVLAAGLLHTGIVYGLEAARQQREPVSTGFPPEGMLLLFVPYALALCLLAAVWFCLHERRRGAGRLDAAIRTCGLLAALAVCAGILTAVLVLIASGGGMDAASFFALSAPFLAAAALLIAVMTVCFLIKRRCAAKRKDREGTEEKL